MCKVFEAFDAKMPFLNIVSFGRFLIMNSEMQDQTGEQNHCVPAAVAEKSGAAWYT